MGKHHTPRVVTSTISTYQRLCEQPTVRIFGAFLSNMPISIKIAGPPTRDSEARVLPAR